jgi:hypothetical protein
MHKTTITILVAGLVGTLLGVYYAHTQGQV